MDSQVAKQSRLPLQFLLGIAVGGVAAAAVILGGLYLAHGKDLWFNDGRSVATNGEIVDAFSKADSVDASRLKRSGDDGHLEDLLSHLGNFGLSLALHEALELKLR